MIGLSPSDLLDLTDLQRDIVLYLTRQGATDANALPQALGRDPPRVRAALSALVERGYVRLLADGRAKVVFGRTRHRTLPAQGGLRKLARAAGSSLRRPEATV